MSDPPEAYTPLRIGDYDFQATLGSGAFSIVKCAVNRTTGRRVAIKVIPKSNVAEDKARLCFDSELSIFRSLSHPNIVQFIDSLEDRINYYVVMEFCANGRLSDYVARQGHLAEPTACKLMNDIGSALLYMHSIGIVHRDLKPENVLLDENDHAKVSDFGLSRFAGEDELLATKCGSLCYAAPELSCDQGYVGQQVDVWGLGIILYVMVTGGVPWSSVKHYLQVITLMRKGQFSIPVSVSSSCRDLITKMMQPRPTDRITLDLALAHEWMTGKCELRRAASFSQMVLPRRSLSETTGGDFAQRKGLFLGPVRGGDGQGAGVQPMMPVLSPALKGAPGRPWPRGLPPLLPR
jgi:serine/threonine protein kinase